MRPLALLIVFALLLAGCSAPAAKPYVHDPAEPTSTRTSRGSGTNAGGPPVTSAASISQDPDDYNFTYVAELTVRVRASPLDGPAPRPFTWVGGNASHVRLTSQIYVNGAKPHSGMTLINGNINGVQLGPPTFTANWRIGGGALMTHRMVTLLVPPITGGYQPVGPPMKAIRFATELPMELIFAGTGWGDVYAKILVEDAQLIKPPEPEGGRRP